MRNILSTIKERWAESIALGISTFLAGLWTRHSVGIYQRLHAAFVDKGILAVLFLAIIGILWALVLFLRERRKNALSGIPRGYTFDRESGACVSDKNGLLFCTACAHENRISELKDTGIWDKSRRWSCVVRKCGRQAGNSITQKR